MIPAAGQGALGLEVRADATALRDGLATLIDPQAWLATHAERAVSRALGGSCSVPLAAHAVWSGQTLSLTAALGDAKVLTRPLLRVTVSGRPADVTGAEAMGVEAAQGLRDAGAASYLSAD
jgi:hydroxymethylbilane synthase